MTDQEKLFEEWAEKYESYVLNNQSTFPFLGYNDLVNDVVGLVCQNSTILDLGIGTGYITQKIFSQKNSKIYGFDVSQKMIDIAKYRLRSAVIDKVDFNDYKNINWADYPNKFDCIIGTYFFHHYTDEVKIEMIRFLLSKLSENGKLIIGDIGFWNEDIFIENKKSLGKQWDSDEYYFNIEKIGIELVKMNVQFNVKYISKCCILLTINNH